jgi:hypothetical protein
LIRPIVFNLFVQLLPAALWTARPRPFCSFWIRLALQVSFRRALQTNRPKVGQNFINVHNVRVFMVHVEQVDLVRQFGPIIRAFLNNRDVKATRIAIDNACSHATRSAFATHDKALHAEKR